MKQYTYKEWLELPEKERAKHNTSIMQAADFDDSKVEYLDQDAGIKLEWRKQ